MKTFLILMGGALWGLAGMALMMTSMGAAWLFWRDLFGVALGAITGLIQFLVGLAMLISCGMYAAKHM